MTDSKTIPEIHFARARDARIAWQRFGQGPTVVAIPPTAQNIEVAWTWPRLRQMFDRFGSFATWVQFDKRGTGASDRRSQEPGIDERVEDLRSVMDDAGIDRAFLYGASEGGPTCLLFAVTYPERVNGLILHGTGPFTAPQGFPDEQREEYLARMREFAATFGTSESRMVDAFAPSIAHEPGFREWHQRYERLSATRDSLAEILEISLSVDVSDVLDQIDVPTLVLHASGDLIIPVEWGRELARAIENAEMHEYDSHDHFGFASIDWVDRVEQFVTGRLVDRPEFKARGRAHIRTLGWFGVEVDGEAVLNSAWGSRLSRQLCKRLVASRGRPISREQLADQLWPDEPEPSRLGPRLSVQLSAVRRVLGGAIIADRQMVALDLNQVTTDLEAFMSTDDDASLVAMYTGDFLVGDFDEPWAAGTRDEARAKFHAAAHRLLAKTGLGGGQGSNDEAESVARKLIELDPWDETAHQVLIRVLRARGLDGDARRAYDVYAAAMREIDIDVDPFEMVPDAT